MKKIISYFIIILALYKVNAQNVNLFQQFNGRYDYTAIGNTLNTSENGPTEACQILTSSSANLTLASDQTPIAAHLYWAGSGEGDFNITLNGTSINAERTFSDSLDEQRVFFAAFADVTTIVLEEGNTTYTVTDFDLTDIIAPFCPTGTNFGGWAINIIYEQSTLPLNQLNVYDGLQSVPESLTITLDNLNVLDDENAKIGFIAWEGDGALAVNEQLSINGNIIGNPPLNPTNNAFNSTNSYTGDTSLYNMDIDFYSIQDNISIGDTTATISLTSGQDFVMINNIITVLNSQLPDATITINNSTIACASEEIILEYTIKNENSTGILEQNTPIAFYANDILIGQSSTLTDIPINGTENGSITLTLPSTTPDSFILKLVVDDDGTGNGLITETDETNNETLENINLIIVPEIIDLPEITTCNIGNQIGQFNLYNATNSNSIFNNQTFTFFESFIDLESNTNVINDPSVYFNTSYPTYIYIRLEDAICYEVYRFKLNLENCPPETPQGFSPNKDGINDWFNIQGLYNIFVNHELKIYNRLGTLIFIGDNEKPWLGYSNFGVNKGNLSPVGTYYYVLNLKDSNYQKIIGWVYLNY